MPCYYTGTAEGDARLDAQTANKAATAATRAACEMASLLTKAQLEKLSKKTVKWIKDHDEVDSDVQEDSRSRR